MASPRPTRNNFFSSLILIIGVINAEIGYAQSPLPVTHFKYRVSAEVFRKVGNTFGRYQGYLSFRIIARSSKKKDFVIAQYTPVKGKGGMITIDEELYDLCRKLGTDSLNALASIIGHEQSHHYRQHTWNETYGLSGSPKGRVQDKKNLETEADFYGCYAAHLAGYNPDRAFPRILDSIYRRFKIADSLYGYGSLDQRKSTYKERNRELHQLVALFRAGQLMYAIKSFTQAADCFARIAQDFPSEEVLTNQAACLLQRFLMSQNERTKKFIFPIEFDVETRIRTGGGVRGNGDVVEAVRLLEEALRLNPTYESAKINLACAQVFKGNYAAAIGVINGIEGSLPANANTARAIAFYHDNQFEKAASDFQAAKRKNAYGADYNLAMFEELNGRSWATLADAFLSTLADRCTELLKMWGSESPSSTASTSKQSPQPHQSLSLDDVNYQRSPSNVVLNNDELHVKPYDNGVYHFAFRTGPKMLVSSPEFKGLTNGGIRVGSSASQLQKAFGRPSYTLPLASDGLLWCRTDPIQSMVFVLLDNKVSYWAICSP